MNNKSIWKYFMEMVERILAIWCFGQMASGPMDYSSKWDIRANMMPAIGSVLPMYEGAGNIKPRPNPLGTNL